jgi:hypothetical protein
MEDKERARWETLLAEHEKEHPAAIIKTVEGLVIQAGFEPVLLEPMPASS